MKDKTRLKVLTNSDKVYKRIAGYQRGHANFLKQVFEESEKTYSETDLPPKKESSYNVSLEGQKGGTNGQKELHSGTSHQQAEGSRGPHQPGYSYR